MTNKEAIKHLQIKLNEDDYYNRLTGKKFTNKYYRRGELKYRLALLYAIKALRDADKKAPSVTPSLILDNITEDEIKKFRLICQRANGKGVCIIYEERGAEDGKAESADRC